MKYYLPLTLAESALGVNDKNREAAEKQLNDQASIKEKASERRRRESTINMEKDSVHARDNASSASYRGDSERGRSSPAPDGSVDGGDAQDDDEDHILGIDEEEGPKDFYHPASVEPQPVVWVPRDTLGLAEAEEQATRQLGIAVSIEHAALDKKAHVDIDGPPPDEKMI